MMRVVRYSAAIAILALAVACNDSTKPSNETMTFTAQLSPANEVPAVTNGEATCSGNVVVTLHVQRDSGGAITSGTADFQVSLTGCPTGTALTAAHIHRGAVGVSGLVVIDTGLTSGQVVLANGAGSFTRTGIAVTTALTQEVLSSPSGFYFNVHSVLNGTGMARGQLVKQ